MFKFFELKTLIAIFICTLSFFAKAQVPVSVCPFIKAYSDSTICKGACKTLKTNYESIKLTNSYGVGSIQYAPYSFTGTPILVNQDDIWSGVVNMNFPFCFYGQYFTKCLIGANGQITFEIAEAG